MKADINTDGYLIIIPETNLEAFALFCWHEKQEGEISGMILQRFPDEQKQSSDGGERPND